MADELPELVVRDAAAWRTWLAKQHANPVGIWLVLAKKGTQKPTSLTYDQVERDGGNGGHEMSLWVMLMGALGGAPGHTIFYEPVKAWMGGVGLLSYDNVLSKHRSGL